MMKHFAATVAAIALFTGSPVLADVGQLSAADSKAVDALISPVLKSLENNSASGSISAFLGTGKTGAIGSAQQANIIAQVNNALSVYGPVSQCTLIKDEVEGSLAVQRTYLCQHTRFLTRWMFIVVKLPDGWSAASLTFDDKINELF